MSKNTRKSGGGRLSVCLLPGIHILAAAAFSVVATASSAAVEMHSGNVNVVAAKGAAPTVRFAAAEMTNYLSRVLGAAVPVSAAPVDGKVNIFLGENEWSRAEGLDPKPLVRDGFISAAKGRKIFLLGVDDARIDPRGCFTGRVGPLDNFERATLNAVYDFLERYADVRFFFPGELGTVVERRRSISVPEGTRRVEPAFTERYFGWWNTAKDGWFDKSETVRAATAKHWLRLRYGSSRKRCCHGQRNFNYVKRFAKTHPEYFCLKADGTRNLRDTGGEPSYLNSKFCYTSGLREEMYQDVKAFLSGASASSRGLKAWGANCRAERGGKYVDIMPEDGFNKCMCPNCQAAYNKKESAYATELIWGLTAEIARRLTGEGVEGGVSQMAYYPYNRVPDFDLPRNVHVMVAVPGPWASANPARHAEQLKTLRGWTSKLGHKVWLWTYPGKYDGKMKGIPEISPRAYAKFFAEAAPYIIGGYLDNDTDRFMFEVLNLYVFAKLAWNPKADVVALLDEWNGRLFGPAAAEMKAVYDLLERKWVDGVCKGRVVESALGPITVSPSSGQLWADIYTPASIAELRGLFDAAAKKTAPGSLEARRVALMRSELFDPIARQSEAADPATELRRRKKEGTANLIANGDFATKKGWSKRCAWGTAELDAADKVTGTASMRLTSDTVPHGETSEVDASAPVSLAKGRTYRLSYFIRTKDVAPCAKVGYPLGAGLCLWLEGGHYVKHPHPLMTGTCGWIHQSHVFSPPVDAPNATLQFRLERSLGTMWFDGVLLEDITDKIVKEKTK